MIDGYKVKDGKVIVVNYDENNGVEEKERIYQDNIEELLVAENIEEHLNDLKIKAEEDIEAYEKKIKKCKDKNSDANVVFAGSLFWGVFSSLIFSFFWVSVIVCIISIGLKIIQVIPVKKKIKNYRKAIAGTEFALEGIMDQINKNQRDLRRLRSDDRRECENIRNGYKQFDLSELDVIDENLELWYRVGENEAKYLNFLDNGTLEQNLEENFEQEEVKVLKRVLTDRKNK